jgi:hypothetical protein
MAIPKLLKCINSFTLAFIKQFMLKKLLNILIIFLLIACNVQAQKWNVDNPPGTVKKVTINTNEGTWMNLDVSPDGKNIVFDLLGDIYTMLR